MAMLLIASINVNVFANSNYTINTGAKKIAYVKNINVDGSNIGNDITNSKSILNETYYDINFELSDQQLSVFGTVNELPISVTAKPTTTNENRNIILYETNSVSESYKILYVSIERELDETALYFRDFHNNNLNYLNVIKLYLQSNKLNDIICIEIFITSDFVNNYLQNNFLEYDSYKANFLQSWFATIYNPVSDNSLISPTAANGTDTIDLSKTYNLNGSTVTYVLKIDLYYNVPDVIKNGNGTASFCFEVIESKVTSNLPANNSSTQNVLRLEDLNITVKTYPYIICTSSTSTRKNIQKNASITSNFSVSFGYSNALISASGNFSYNKSGTTTRNSETKIYTNTATTGNRQIETGKLPSNYYLVKEEGQYGYNLVLQDMGGTSTSQNIKVTYDFYVNNLCNSSDSNSYSRIIFMPLRVK